MKPKRPHPKLEYDPESGACYVRLRPRTKAEKVFTLDLLGSKLIADLDRNGDLVGVEIVLP